jgi:hypothetical protein
MNTFAAVAARTARRGMRGAAALLAACATAVVAGCGGSGSSDHTVSTTTGHASTISTTGHASTTSTTHASLAFELASLDDGDANAITPPLRRIRRHCANSKNQIGGTIDFAYRDLRRHGFDVSLLDVVNAISQSIPDGAQRGVDCEKLVAAYLTLRESH